MQPSIEGSVDQPPHSQPRYQLCYLGSNDIGRNGFAFVKNMCKQIQCQYLYRLWFVYQNAYYFGMNLNLCLLLWQFGVFALRHAFSPIYWLLVESLFSNLLTLSWILHSKLVIIIFLYWCTGQKPAKMYSMLFYELLLGVRYEF